MPSRTSRLVLGIGLAYLAGVITAVAELDAVLRHLTPVSHHPGR